MLRTLFSALLLLCMSARSSGSWLFQRGGKLYDEAGEQVRLTGVNWFGFETSNRAPHGLWTRDYQGMLTQVAQLSFNCLRVPWSNAILQPGAQAQGITFYGSDPFRPSDSNRMNQELEGKTPLEILDSIVAACSRLGLKVILDNHSREPDGYMNEALWYTASVSHRKWIDDWVSLAKRYRGNKCVVGFDLNNEPHGKSGVYAEWGTGNPETDWRLAAQECGNAILEVNPDALILVEGVESAAGSLYWWGGNLSGVHEQPVVLSNPEKLVYSPHEYGPEVYAQEWFDAPGFPDNMNELWNGRFGFIDDERIGHLLVGEFGIRDTASNGGRAGTWFDRFLAYMGTRMSWTFWCLNPNSGDTGGILGDDWVSVKQWKVDRLKPYMAPKIHDTGGTGAFETRPRKSERLAGGAFNSLFTLRGRRLMPAQLSTMSGSVVLRVSNGRAFRALLTGTNHAFAR
jgi:endoglucanase